MAALAEEEGTTSAAGTRRRSVGAFDHLKWSDDLPQFVNGSAVTLSTAGDLLKVKVVDPKRGMRFEQVFDESKLIGCGFHFRMHLDKIMQLIRGALRGSESLSTRFEAADESGAIKLVIKQAFFAFESTYTMPLSGRLMDATDKLSAELAVVRSDSSKKDTVIADLRQSNESVAKAKEEAVAETMRVKKELTAAIETEESAKRQLADARIQIERMEAAMTKSTVENERMKRRIAATESLMEEMHTEIRARDERLATMSSHSLTVGRPVIVAPTVVTPIREAPTVYDFVFDSVKKSGFTTPDNCVVTVDGKSAMANARDAQILLEPSLDCGTHTVQFVVSEKKGWFAVGVTDDFDEDIYDRGCYFDSQGDVRTNGTRHSGEQPFGGWKQGDKLLLRVDLDSATVYIKSPNGELTVDWRPTSTPVWFLFYSRMEGTKLSIV